MDGSLGMVSVFAYLGVHGGMIQLVEVRPHFVCRQHSWWL